MKLFDMELKTKLLISYIFLITIPSCIIGFRYYTLSKDVISDIAKKNVYEIVRKNNEIIDTKLSQIQENIFSFTVDPELYKAFSEIHPETEYDIQLLDYKISNVLNKYFSHSQDIYSAQLATSYFTFSPMSSNVTAVKSFIPEGAFINSELYKVAKAADGKLQWFPTYKFDDMFNVGYMKDVNIDYRYLFSAVEMVRSSYFDGSNYLTLANDVERPVLLVNLKEEFFQRTFRNSIPIEGSFFFVITKNGQVVSHQEQSKITTIEDMSWLGDILKKQSGTDSIIIDGKKMIICYDTSKITGWMSIAVIPSDRLVNQILLKLRYFVIYGAIILISISIFISYIISSKITKPIKKLISGIKKIGEGNFNVKVKDVGGKEFKELISKFNAMNDKIQKLIKENYEIKIKEKEAEIMALNLQLDPHFMYNTLNLINLISMENGQDEISEMIMSLSTMLKYTVKNKKDIVSFEEDIYYLKGYIFIMTKRFEGRFSVEYNIDKRLYGSSVPKFLMQPFVENSLIHGFETFKPGSRLVINCWIDGNTGYFSVEDNGCGMSSEKLDEIVNNKSNSVGISNIENRIKIIYGEGYGVKFESELGVGTKVTIKLPL